MAVEPDRLGVLMAPAVPIRQVTLVLSPSISYKYLCELMCLYR